MPLTPHVERHFQASATIRDIVIGMSDGLTVPFALAAGLTGAIARPHVIVVAGLAEIAAGSIAMGLGGYLAAKSDRDHYRSELEREHRECEELPVEEAEEVARVFRGYGMTEEQIAPVVEHIKADSERWVDFMMKFELGLEEPDPRRARSSAMTIAGSYVAGGLVPLAPYMFADNIMTGLYISVCLTLAALFAFGWFKAQFTGIAPLRGAAQTVLIGGLASAAAFTIARAIS